MITERSGASIEVRNLVKRFGDVRALSGVDFTVREGELFGLLGPNGAGKTTTINILTGLARPDAGSIRIGGVDCTGRSRMVQRLLGVVPDESNLYPELTGFQNLCFCAALYGMSGVERRSRARDLLDLFGLRGAADRRFAHYSKGMKRKLTIAAGIIHRPEILFLDEPTTGIDVASARQVRQLIADLHRSGTTIVLTTHYIEEAERLCDRIAFIVSGRIVREDTVEHLLQPVQRRNAVEIVCAQVPSDIRGTLSARFSGLELTIPRQGLIRVEAGEPIPVGPLVRFLEDHAAEVAEARRIRPSLEDVFVEITGVATEEMRREKERGEGSR